MEVKAKPEGFKYNSVDCRPIEGRLTLPALTEESQQEQTKIMEQEAKAKQAKDIRALNRQQRINNWAAQTLGSQEKVRQATEGLVGVNHVVRHEYRPARDKTKELAVQRGQ